MQKSRAIMVVVIVLIIGFFNILYRIIKINKDQEVVIKYQNKLIEFLNSRNNGKILYENLTYLNMKSFEVQNIIDTLGMTVSVIDPILGMQYSNYQVIINGIDEISRDLSLGFNQGITQAGIMMSNCAGKYIGHVDTNRKELISYMKNPFIWLREGVRVIVGFPIFFLYWTGLIQYSRYSKIKNNIIIKFIGFTIGFMGFVGTVITIITGYKPSIEIIKQFLRL